MRCWEMKIEAAHRSHVDPDDVGLKTRQQAKASKARTKIIMAVVRPVLRYSVTMCGDHSCMAITGLASISRWT